MAATATTALQLAIMAAAGHYLIQPKPYLAASGLAAEQTQRAFRHLSEHDATRAVTDTLRTYLQRLPERVRPTQPSPQAEETKASDTCSADASPGATEADLDENGGETATEEGDTESAETSDPAFTTTPDTPGSSTSPWSETFFHEPANFFGPAEAHILPEMEEFELDEILSAVHKRRKLRHEDMQSRIHRYNSSAPFFQEEVPEKKAKKTVRFTLDTKPGSAETSSKPEDKLLSPLPPSPESELAHFSASIAVPGGSVFAHPYDFHEAELIRRLPSQMKNGAGGLAWCRGRTEQGLYMLDTPVKRLLLDLRVGVCYDGSNGRMMGVEETIGCVLAGRGKVEETWGGFKWKRGLEEKAR